MQRQNLRVAFVAVPFLVLALVASIKLNAMLDAGLQARLYRPACAAVCVPHGGMRNEPRRGGRGHRDEVYCPCLGGGDARMADLSKGSALDRALHWGLKDVILVGGFVVVSLIGFGLGIGVAGLAKR